MQDKLNIYINNAIDLEEKGEYKKALKILENCYYIYEKNQYEILFEIAKLQFRNENYSNAIINFVTCANQGNKMAQQIIWDSYYKPNENKYKTIYENNRNSILKYKHFYGEEIKDFLELSIQLIWKDENIIIYYYNNTFLCQEITQDNNIQEVEISDNVVFISNNININFLINTEKSAKNEDFLTMKIPVYVYFDHLFLLEVLLQFEEFPKLLNSERVVFLIGLDRCKLFFSKPSTIVPSYLIGEKEILEDFFMNIQKKKNENLQEFREEIFSYYTNNKTISYNIKSGKPRILFITSRFTTALQYHTKNSLIAAKKIGLETRLLIEESDIHRFNSFVFYETINEFKPDVIFIIDHFRFEYNEIPNEIMWICWTQDFMTDIMSKESLKKLLPNDIILNHFTTWKTFLDIGYDKVCKVIEAPIPANEEIYKPYKLTVSEKEKYGSDICLVCHGADTETYIKDFVLQFNLEVIRERAKEMFWGYVHHVKETGNFWYSIEEFELYVKYSFEDLNMITSEWIYAVAKELYESFNQRVFRTTIVDWMIEAGYTNIKLWGKGWIREPKYAKYAMGIAENGTTLSKIFQASKINIGNNIMTTSAARTWECTLSGGFYMSNFIPEDADVTDIRKIVTLDKDIVCFRNKEELLNNIEYYLHHEEERKEMIQRGRTVALKKMTFKTLIQKTLKEIKEV